MQMCLCGPASPALTLGLQDRVPPGLPLGSPLLEQGGDEESRDQRQRAADRRRESDPNEAALAAQRSPTEFVRMLERNVDPVSRTFERRQNREIAGEHAADSRRGFREALSDASQSLRETAQKPATQTAAATQPSVPNAAAPNAEPTAAQPASAPATPPQAPPPAAAPAAPAAMNPAAAAAPRPTHAVIRATPARPAPPAARLATSAPAALVAAGANAQSASSASSSSAAKPGAQPAAAAAGPPRAFARVLNSTTRAARTDAAPRNDAGANIDRLVRVVRGRLSESHSRATLRLDPPEIGTIRIHMDLRRDVLHLRLDTDTGSAHRLLSDQLDTLRHALAQSGIRLESVEVRPPTQPDEPGHEPWQPPQEQGDDSQQPSDDSHEAHRDTSDGSFVHGGREPGGPEPDAPQDAAAAEARRLNVTI